MAVVAIPFHNEDQSVVRANLLLAANHPLVDRVWAVCDPDHEETRRVFSGMEPTSRIEIVPDRRIGRFRPGKGDAMNSALHLAASQDVDRLHFYDADITNFTEEWITGAENAADRGYQVVRHTFPRAATDAMITWLITKPLFALGYPGTVLPRIGQPLGGELLLTGPAIKALARDDTVAARSDWGIDTLLTFSCVAHGFSLYEHHVPDGKRHSLYGSLFELKTMLIECFDAASTLPESEIPQIDHLAEPKASAPASLKTETGYSVEATLPLLTAPWQPGEAEVAKLLPDPLDREARAMVKAGDYSFLDEQAWGRIIVALRHVPPPGRDSLLFRLWVGRVLNYTKLHADRGYDHAVAYLARTISEYESSVLR